MRWLATVYVVLNASSIAVIVVLLWRVKHLVTLAQRSNVETLTLLIAFVLALNYLVTTWRGFSGAARIAIYNAPHLWGADALAVERRKHAALPGGDEAQVVYLDRAVACDDDDGAVAWECGDDAGTLGTVTIRGVEMSYEPRTSALNNSFFEYLVHRIDRHLMRRDPPSRLRIAFWSEIRDSEAAAYHSTVDAFRNLERAIDRGPLWPVVALTRSDIEAIQNDVRAIAPALRDEAFLPNMEYEAEYSVPILPEPLAFLQLRRTDERADPIATMAWAAAAMTLVLAVLITVVAWPPWVPSK